MSPSVVLHFAGLGLVLLLGRLGGGPTDPLFQSQIAGWLLLLAGVFLTVRSSGREGGAGAARRWTLVGQGLGVVGLLGVTVLSLDQLDALSLDDDGRLRCWPPPTRFSGWCLPPCSSASIACATPAP